jgi:uncharacterized protein YjiK
VKNIAQILGKESVKFKPSGATINPFNDQLWVLSSAGDRLLVTARRNGNIIQAYPLPRDIFKQPEGIAIAADRTLFISNESAGQGAPNILVMRYRNKKK